MFPYPTPTDSYTFRIQQHFALITYDHCTGEQVVRNTTADIYRLRLKGYGLEEVLEYRAHEVPQCQMIAAYRAEHGLDKTAPPLRRDDSYRPGKRKRKRKQVRREDSLAANVLATPVGKIFQ